MKKIILLLFIVFTSLQSCSTDNIKIDEEENNNELMFRHKSIDSLEILYNDMIASQSYRDFKIDCNTFFTKMNYDGNGSDLESSALLLSWISSNIVKTQFNSYADAVNEHERVMAAASLAFQSNISFFREYLDSDSHTFIPWSPTPPSSPYNECTDKCDGRYFNEMQELGQWMRSHPSEAWANQEQQEEIMAEYEFREGWLTALYEVCIENCD